MNFQPSLLTLTLFALFAHTGLAWTDEGWVTTYSYDGSDCSGEVLAINSGWAAMNNECSVMAYLFSAYAQMEHMGVKLQCSGSNTMIISTYTSAWCQTQVGSSQTIRSGECNVDNEGKAYKIFFSCWTGSKHDYDSDAPQKMVQIVGEWHDDSTCSGNAEQHLSDTVLQQDYCYRSKDDEHDWQNSYKITCDGDKATQFIYHTNDCSDEPREVETIEDVCLHLGLGTTWYIKADVTCGEASMLDQALSWFKQQAENLNISQETLVGLVAGGSSVGGLSLVLLVYRCCCTGGSKRSVVPRLRDLV